MRDAYARAGACLDAALPAGLASWRTLAAALDQAQGSTA